jgi:CTP:molybdopterin cytidylyltransferase MocA
MDALVEADVVLLAGGRSARMGEPKGLVVVKGRPWVEHQIEAIGRTGGRRVLLVLGHDQPAYEQALPQLDRLAEVVTNPDPDRGPFSSLQCGMAQVAPGTAVFVLPIDVPAPSPDVWKALLEALRAGGEAAVPVHDGRGGHPVLLAAPLVRRLLGRPPEGRLDAELAELSTAGGVVRVPVDDPLVRLNLNAPEDWGKLEVDRGS